MGDEEDVAYDRSGSSLATNCQTDSFSAQAASPSSSPPEVCGSNSGSHSKRRDETRAKTLTS